MIIYKYTTVWNIFTDRDKHNLYTLTGAARHAGHNTLDLHGDLPQQTTKEQTLLLLSCTGGILSESARPVVRWGLYMRVMRPRQ